MNALRALLIAALMLAATPATASAGARADLPAMTLAPELPGALELIDLLLARGVVVSAGHTDASAVRRASSPAACSR